MPSCRGLKTLHSGLVPASLSALWRLRTVRHVRRAAEERHMRMRSDPGIADLRTGERHGGAPLAVERLAVGVVAGRIPHRQPDREQPVGRDQRFRIIEPPYETVDG